jgi:serine/threonine protein kinase
LISDDAVARLRTVASVPDFTGTRYELVREIGRGGMGIVYEGIDRELSRTVAIKVVSERNAEAQLTATLEHPGIVPVHDAGTLPDGRAFYVMKLVRGATLGDAHHPSGQEALRLFVRICEPVAFAHARGVVHCDLKPSNVMLGEFGEVLVMDWGIANRSGGTKGYMAPEQERGEISPAADVFALGTILRHMTVRPNRRLRAIIAKAMAPDTTSRYPTATELIEDVTRFVDGRDIAAYRESPLERFSRWGYRNRALLAVIAAYLIMRAIVVIAARL